MKYLKKIGDYWNTRSEGYQLQIEKELSENAQEPYLKAFKEIPIGSSVLDIGCGPGFFSYLLSVLEMKVTAVDYSEGMIAQAKAFLEGKGFSSVSFVRADAQNLPFEDGIFDAVVSRNLVWNLEEPEKAYAEWLRVLRPGGKVFIFDGNHYLHLYSEDYASVQKTVETESNHILLGVKTHTIDEIAEALPSSRRLRPEWDEVVLKELGAGNIQTKVIDWAETPSHKRLAVKFRITAEK